MVLGGYHIGAWLKVRSCLTSLLKMGICWPKLAPSKHKDELVSSKSSTVVPTSSSTTDYESSTHETISCEANRAEAKRNIPGVELIGDLLCPFTLRVLIALQFKGILVNPTWLTPADLKNPNRIIIGSPNGKYPVLQYGLHRLIGSTGTMLDYIEETFQDPPLIPRFIRDEVMKWVAFIRDEFTPILVQLIYDGSHLEQHKMTLNLESAFAELNNGKCEHGKHGRYFLGNQFTLVDVYLIPSLLLVDVAKFFRGITIGTVHSHLLSYSQAMEFGRRGATAGKQMQLLWKMYGRLVVLMQEHAQMEEMVLFPAIDSTDEGTMLTNQRLSVIMGNLYTPGMSGTALTDHARDLPVMNGIREDIKGVMALEQGYSDYLGVQALATRLRVYQHNTVVHYREEERDLLPQLNLVDLGCKKQEDLVTQCFQIMEESHERLLPFLLQGMEPYEVNQYLGLLQKSFVGGTSRLFTRNSHYLKNLDEEFGDVCQIARERISELVAP
uniref:GST N-terminal domain-containing protein n=1 Tax=Physcomitrium patens TaxID=3218 RepID=A0A7I4CMW1_PHYPA